MGKKKDKKKGNKKKYNQEAATQPHDTSVSENIMAQADVIKAVDEALQGCTPAAVVRLIEGVIKADTTPAGEYAFISPTGHQIIITKSGGIGKKTWQLDGEKVTRSEAYNTIKDSKIKAAAPAEGEVVDGPPKKHLKATYKKKQIMNVLKANQMFDKNTIKMIKQDMTEKKVTGGTLVTILDDVVGEEVPTATLVNIFNALNE